MTKLYKRRKLQGHTGSPVYRAQVTQQATFYGGTFFRLNEWKLTSYNFSTGPAAKPSGRSSPPLLAGGDGARDPPCVLASWRWGPIYIAVHTQRMELWATSLKFWRLLMWWKGQSILFAGQRNLRRCLLQPSIIHLGTMASSSPTAWQRHSTGRRA